MSRGASHSIVWKATYSAGLLSCCRPSCAIVGGWGSFQALVFVNIRSSVGDVSGLNPESWQSNLAIGVGGGGGVGVT